LAFAFASSAAPRASSFAAFFVSCFASSAADRAPSFAALAMSSAIEPAALSVVPAPDLRPRA
jgi:hypothetical protein